MIMPKKGDYLFTSESVSDGHPDKICDSISDKILDYYLSHDPESRVAVETMATTNRVIISGEVSSKKEFDKKKIDEIARAVVRDIGYEQDGFHWENLKTDIYIHSQSPEIAAGVGSKLDESLGAGDQGIMFGYACTETDEYMPAAISYSHKILQSIRQARKNANIGLRPDAKSQVTLDYRNGIPVKAKSIVVSSQHDPDLSQRDVHDLIIPHITDSLPDGWMCDESDLYINPTGSFVVGGPDGDTGLTGRKIIVDTYGGAAPHGGGAFSGKDPTKVDRSGAYAARYLAKNIVAAGLADRCTVQIAYAIGISKPLALYINLHQTGVVSGPILADKILSAIDLSPYGILKHFDMLKPIYNVTSSYGHFGRPPEASGAFSWEKLDLAEYLRTLF